MNQDGDVGSEGVGLVLVFLESEVGENFIQWLFLGNVEECFVEIGDVLEGLVEVPLEDVVAWGFLDGSQIRGVLELVGDSEFGYFGVGVVHKVASVFGGRSELETNGVVLEDTLGVVDLTILVDFSITNELVDLVDESLLAAGGE